MKSYKVFIFQEEIANIEESNSETDYALQEHIDKVLDLKMNESRYFQPNRDEILKLLLQESINIY